ncbi:MAG: hypothetical protein MSC30_14460 [Gaiellaceae bacterium MAG52_C11]|nr:hypothetical protein [Candidatus Gaiellasilicea maunaloa]
MIFRRNRFADLVRRQLDLFVAEEAELLAEVVEAERAYDAAEREDAEHAYADFQLVLDTGRDRLAEIQATYAATLDEVAAREYEAAFVRATTRRFPRFVAGL